MTSRRLKPAALGLLALVAAGPACIAPAAAQGSQVDTEPARPGDLGELSVAAEAGDPAAQNNLGVMYATGRGVARSLEAAAMWYRRAAEQGYAVAQYNLATMYEHGQGVPADKAAALVWYELAARQGDHWAQYNLARLQLSQDAADLPSAYRWFYLAAETAEPDLKSAATDALDRVGRMLNAKQMAQAREYIELTRR